MPKRRLALVMAFCCGGAAVIDLALAVSLAMAHRSFTAPLVALSGCTPGLAFAVLAWRGTSQSQCAPSVGSRPAR